MNADQPDRSTPQPLNYAPPAQRVRFAMHLGGWIVLIIVAIIAVAWQFHRR